MDQQILPGEVPPPYEPPSLPNIPPPPPPSSHKPLPKLPSPDDGIPELDRGTQENTITRKILKSIIVYLVLLTAATAIHIKSLNDVEDELEKSQEVYNQLVASDPDTIQRTLISMTEKQVQIVTNFTELQREVNFTQLKADLRRAIESQMIWELLNNVTSALLRIKNGTEQTSDLQEMFQNKTAFFNNLKQLVTNTTDQISKLAPLAQNLTSQMENNLGKVANESEKVKTFKNNIATLSTNVTSNKAEAENLQSAINSLNASVVKNVTGDLNNAKGLHLTGDGELPTLQNNTLETYDISISLNTTLSEYLNRVKSAFSSYMYNTEKASTGILPFAQELTDIGDDFDKGAYNYKCPVSGTYLFTFSVQSGDVIYPNMIKSLVALKKNGDIKLMASSASGMRSVIIFQGLQFGVMHCSKGDIVKLDICCSNSTVKATTMHETTFSGVLLFEDPNVVG